MMSIQKDAADSGYNPEAGLPKAASRCRRSLPGIRRMIMEKSNSTPPSTLLRLALWGGVAYFCCMAVAHFFGLKYPLLFVYYDVPFHAYQDKIISFAVVAYICLFVNAAMHRSAVPGAIVALAVTVLGLSAVNASEDLGSVLDGRSTIPYWVQTGLLAAYFAVLVALYGADKQASRGHG